MSNKSRRVKSRRLPVALTIAGSDSGGGAGIQADLKTFAAIGVHGTSVITCVTAQNPKRVLGVQAAQPGTVLDQLVAVFEEMPPEAMKTGMLYSPVIVRTIVNFLAGVKERPPLVVDPVMRSTSGSQLLQLKATALLTDRLLPLASLVTPNLAEAERLTGFAVADPEAMRQAARFIQKNFGCAALVKGGHLKGFREAIDIFYDGKDEFLLRAPFINGVVPHGTGCTYSAAIAGFLALGLKLPAAVQHAKEHITQAIAQRVRVGSYAVLNYFP